MPRTRNRPTLPDSVPAAVRQAFDEAWGDLRELQAATQQAETRAVYVETRLREPAKLAALPSWVWVSPVE